MPRRRLDFPGSPASETIFSSPCQAKTRSLIKLYTPLMYLLIVGFLASTLLTFAVIVSGSYHSRLSADHDLAGPQKFHATAVPRIGGIGIFFAAVVGALFAKVTGKVGDFSESWLVLVCSLPTFLSGVAEDLVKSVSPGRRLLLTAVSASLGCWLLQAVLPRTDIPGLELLLAVTPVAVVLTVFAVSGVANAINIIDGFNGLASMCVLLILASLSYVAFQVGDIFLMEVGLLLIGCVFGFFIWNFPAGLVFLGDGGAYFLGFMVAELGVLLIARHPNVSPLFPLLTCAYPIFETVFSMYRRKVIRGVATGAPDGIHLHTLIHRRLIRWTLESNTERRRLKRRNSMTSTYLWSLCLLCVIPGVMWWNDTRVLASFLLLFIISYVWLYRCIVRFRTPKWLIFRRHG